MVQIHHVNEVRVLLHIDIVLRVFEDNGDDGIVRGVVDGRQIWVEQWEVLRQLGGVVLLRVRNY